ncbi:MAG: chemotaxis protein CheA [Nitrospirae bacterium]|nr:chemotaxis protein CheA [Nitrospirota bacterium]
MPEKRKFHEFLVESEDIVQSISNNLLRMQSSALSSKYPDQELINDIFRSMHTLKGISSTFGFSNLTRLSHRLEDMLDDLRMGRIMLSGRLLDTLFEGIDVLVRLLTCINEKGVENIDINSIMEKIDLFENVEGGCENGSVTPADYLSTEMLNGLNDYELTLLENKIRDGEFLYRIKAGFPVNTIDTEIDRLRETMKKSGEIIALIPVSGFSGNDLISFNIIFSSKEIRTTEMVNEIVKDYLTNIEEIESYNIPHSNVTIEEDKNKGASAKSITKTVRVGIERLDVLLNTVGEIFLLNDTMSQLIKEVKNGSDNNRNVRTMAKASKELYKRLTVLRNDIIDIRLVPISYLFERVSGIVNKLCSELSKDVEIKLSGGDTKLDKAMIEGLADPLMHIIRNAMDHGIEDEEIRIGKGKPQRGTIELSASHRESRIIIDIKDDGAGIDFSKISAVALNRGLITEGENPEETEMVKFLFSPGFSTRASIDEVSGRGIGLDVVAKNIASLGGMIDVESAFGRGTKFSIILPLTLLIARALIVNDSGRQYAIPFNYISEILVFQDHAVKKTGIKEVFNLRGHFIPVIRLQETLVFMQSEQIPHNPPSAKGGRVDLKRKQYVIVVGLAEKRVGIVVDAIKSQREILIKPLNELLGTVPGITGFTEIDSKSVVPVLDVGGIIEKCKV